MSHYTLYSEYKESDVEWIGQVPEHWELSRLKFLTSKCQNGVWGDDPLEDGTDTLCIRVADFDRENLRVVDNPSTYRQISEEHQRGRLVSKGDILLEKSGGGEKTPVGANVQYLGDENSVCSNFVAVVKPSEKSDPKWLNYLMATMYDIKINLKSIKQATGIQNLDSEQYLSEVITHPSIQEQKIIAEVVVHETTRINTLITKKTRFIELLKEKRQALITHAVTKGLNPDVKMKNSGVEWIGDVPEHWAVCKLSYRYTVELGKMLDEKKMTGDHPVCYLRNKDVQWKSINTVDLPTMDISPEEIDRYTIRNGDLIVCEGGDIGRAAIWRGPDYVIGYQKALHRLRAVSAKKDTAEFYFFALFAAKSNGVFEEGESKSTISHLPAEKFREYRFAFPPAEEQKSIVDFLCVMIGRIDLILEKTQRSIDLLKERRSAFITAAITGQIDLRGEPA